MVLPDVDETTAAAVSSRARELEPVLVQWRRKLHRLPEPGWGEFQTAALVVRVLRSLGFSLRLGRDAVDPAARLGVSESLIEQSWARAEAAGLPQEELAPMRGGLTGVIAELRGQREGPTIALRFDMDALPITESDDTTTHRPAREGWASEYPGLMHACGHDGHVAIGLGVASVLASLKDRLEGTVRLLFQPAEEGARGAEAMAAVGAVDSVEVLLCSHLGLGAKETGEIVAGTDRFFASTKYEAVFRGRSAHAGLEPEHGRNALLAAASATLALYGLSQAGAGLARVNVGTLTAGESVNTVPAWARMGFEVRSDVPRVHRFLEQRAREVLEGASAMYGVHVTLTCNGRAEAGQSDPELAAAVAQLAQQVAGVRRVIHLAPFGASEDATTLMNRVQAAGGRATYMLFGTTLAGGHHQPTFDFDEAALPIAVEILALTVLAVLRRVRRGTG